MKICIKTARGLEYQHSDEDGGAGVKASKLQVSSKSKP